MFINGEKKMKEVFTDLKNNEEGLKGLSERTIEEIAEVYENLTQHDRPLQQTARRFSLGYVKEVQIKLVSPADESKPCLRRMEID